MQYRNIQFQNQTKLLNMAETIDAQVSDYSNTEKASINVACRDLVTAPVSY